MCERKSLPSALRARLGVLMKKFIINGMTDLVHVSPLEIDLSTLNEPT